MEKGGCDDHLEKLMESVDVQHVLKREADGFNAKRSWKDMFSGGEKQRVAMARLYFHKPTFAILDECTSAVSVDVEDKMYSQAKALGITLITTSHRKSLWKFHEYVLKFKENTAEFTELNESEMEKENVKKMSIYYKDPNIMNEEEIEENDN